MTARQRDLLQWILAIAAPLVAIGVLWGTTTAAVAGKLDASRFVADSTRRDTETRLQFQILRDELTAIRTGQDETNTRLREIACPPTARGCR